MDISEEITRKYKDIFKGLPRKGEGNLRFGESIVKISSIAAQFYCEKKLELQNLYPMPPTKRMQMGSAGHESVTTLAEPITREESVKEALVIREKPVCIYEFDIGWIYNDVPIIGKVDEAWFRRGDVDLVVERKFSNVLRIYSGHHIQAQLYCLGLGEMGFNNDPTVYRIMVFKRSCYDCIELIDRSCPIFNVEKTDCSCDEGETKAFNYPFNRVEITKELDWALDYWLGKREAIPSGNPAKCRACDYNNICDSSLMRYSKGVSDGQKGLRID